MAIVRSGEILHVKCTADIAGRLLGAQVFDHRLWEHLEIKLVLLSKQPRLLQPFVASCTRRNDDREQLVPRRRKHGAFAALQPGYTMSPNYANYANLH